MPPSSVESELDANSDFLEGAAEGLVRAGDQNASASLQFFDNLRMGLLRSIGVGAPPAGANSIFVLAERPREVAAQLGATTRLIDLDLRPASEWDHKIVVVAREGNTGWLMPFKDGDLTASVGALINGGHGTRPTAVVYGDQAIVSCLIDGLEKTDSPIRMNLPANSRAVTAANLAEVLEIIRSEGLSTPAVCPPNLWEDGPNYIPGKETERLLQWCVASEMRAFFRPIVAEREQVVHVGRIDVCLTDPKGTIHGGTLHPAVVELKVLRSKTNKDTRVSDRANTVGILKGMRQIKAYKLKKNAQLGVLACFDLRRIKTDILSEPAVVSAAGRYGFGANLFTEMLKLYGDPAHAQEAIAVC